MKHLIKDNKIIQSGLPSHFTRESGETFWGGYETMTDLHYEDGWREEITPEYDVTSQTLGELVYDSESDTVSRVVIDISIDIESYKSRYMSELASLRSEIAVLILQIQLTNDSEPERLKTVIPLARTMYITAKKDILALTLETVNLYVLRNKKVNQILSILRSML